LRILTVAFHPAVVQLRLQQIEPGLNGIDPRSIELLIRFFPSIRCCTRDPNIEIIADLSGPDGLSEGQRQLARRATTIAIACERLEGEAAAGNAIDLEVYGTLTDRLGRCFQRLGLKRQMRDVGPTLADIIREDWKEQSGA
jgi:hypothetical protein